jgi:hypothetical protein
MAVAGAVWVAVSSKEDWIDEISLEYVGISVLPPVIGIRGGLEVRMGS